MFLTGQLPLELLKLNGLKKFGFWMTIGRIPLHHGTMGNSHQLKIARSQSGLPSWLGDISYNSAPHS